MPTILQLLEEGMSYGEIGRTLGINRKTISLRVPGRGWSQSDGGRLGMANRYAAKQIAKIPGQRVWNPLPI